MEPAAIAATYGGDDRRASTFSDGRDGQTIERIESNGKKDRRLFLSGSGPIERPMLKLLGPWTYFVVCMRAFTFVLLAFLFIRVRPSVRSAIAMAAKEEEEASGGRSVRSFVRSLSLPSSLLWQSRVP